MFFSIHQALTLSQISHVRELMRAYGRDGCADLSSQDFEAEITTLPGKYSPPTGALFLATDDNGVPLGCVALHKLGQTADAEIKRLFVRSGYRGFGVGTALLEATINAATAMKCRRIVLDTMPTMTAAIEIYKSLGFEQIDAYWDNVLPVIFFGKNLETQSLLENANVSR